ncbi:MAG: hypothetical protein HYV95_12075 [Opitutae bacterium]|nr:hypothetical protein [Opitutae bacterium]
MKNVELSDEAFAALQRLAAAKNLPPAEVLASLLGAGRPLSGDHLLFYLVSAEFTTFGDPVDRYLALLAWVARSYACDFADFVSHQDSARRYLMLSRDEANSVRSHNHARQIDGTQFWAVMNIDDATRARFVRRLLEFVGCHDETVTQAIRAVGLKPAESHGFRLLSA